MHLLKRIVMDWLITWDSHKEHQFENSQQWRYNS